MNNSFTVSSLNQYIKSKFDSDFTLKGIRLEGEISNYKAYPSGHIYFSLKDDKSIIKAVMFSDFTRYISSPIKDGDKVIALGYVSVYPQRGEYQFYAQAIDLFGKGDILLELERLKKKLQAEGLFDESHKREINLFPKAIGIICAPNSAALSDIKTNLLRRYPLVELKEFLAQVQGEGAIKDLIRAVNEASKEDIDTLIIGRGGGASEDLSAFNDETLVRLIYNFKVPVISAVGHEVDFTLIDYVSDKRASTPTGAAELATIDKREIYQAIDMTESSLDDKVNNLLSNLTNKVDNFANRKIYVSAKEIYETKLEKLENIEHNLDSSMKNILDRSRDKISYIDKYLDSISPDNVFSRGYSLALDEKGKVIKSIKDISLNQMINVKLSGGTLSAKVMDKKEG